MTNGKLMKYQTLISGRNGKKKKKQTKLELKFILQHLNCTKGGKRALETYFCGNCTYQSKMVYSKREYKLGTKLAWLILIKPEWCSLKKMCVT